MNDDLGTPVHYTAVTRGTPVFDREGVEVGTVKRVQDNFREHILDGFEIADADGVVRFVDGPEVSRTFERGVTLAITAAELADHAKPVEGKIQIPGAQPGGPLSRLFRGR